MYYCYHNPEPFPAIMMPRFGHQQTASNQVEYTDVELLFTTNNGQEFVISRHELFEDMHLPQRYNAVSKVFSLDSKSEENPDFVQWLQTRIFSITKYKHGTLEAKWHKIKITKTKEALERDREEINTKIIEI